MNTSGPSSRPRKPYPLALLNHLTVPFKRSTCAPLSCGFPEKAPFGGSAKKCVGIVLLTGGAVKAWSHIAMVGTTGPGKVGPAFIDRPRALLPCRSRHLSQPQDATNRLGIADASLESHPFCFR